MITNCDKCKISQMIPPLISQPSCFSNSLDNHVWTREQGKFHPSGIVSRRRASTSSWVRCASSSGLVAITMIVIWRTRLCSQIWYIRTSCSNCSTILRSKQILAWMKLIKSWSLGKLPLNKCTFSLRVSLWRMNACKRTSMERRSTRSRNKLKAKISWYSPVAIWRVWLMSKSRRTQRSGAPNTW